LTQLQDAQRLLVGVAAWSDALLHLLYVSISLFAHSCTFLLLLGVFVTPRSALDQYTSGNSMVPKTILGNHKN